MVRPESIWNFDDNAFSFLYPRQLQLCSLCCFVVNDHPSLVSPLFARKWPSADRRGCHYQVLYHDKLQEDNKTNQDWPDVARRWQTGRPTVLYSSSSPSHPPCLPLSSISLLGPSEHNLTVSGAVAMMMNSDESAKSFRTTHGEQHNSDIDQHRRSPSCLSKWPWLTLARSSRRAGWSFCQHLLSLHETVKCTMDKLNTRSFLPFCWIPLRPSVAVGERGRHHSAANMLSFISCRQCERGDKRVQLSWWTS